MARLSVSNSARSDIRRIILYLSVQAGPDVALRYVEQFETVLEQLREFPGSGAPRPKCGRSMRIVVVSPYLVFYEGGAKAKAVAVLRVLHGSRKITRTLISKGRDPAGA
jgi:toxin ParE1/3/4